MLLGQVPQLEVYTQYHKLGSKALLESSARFPEYILHTLPLLGCSKLLDTRYPYE